MPESMLPRISSHWVKTIKATYVCVQMHERVNCISHDATDSCFRALVVSESN